MDNTLICTVNRNVELAMAKYSSITGQLAEIRRKILGSGSETVQKTEEEESSTGSNLSKKSSSFPKTSEESIGQISEINGKTVSNSTISSSERYFAQPNAERENGFGELIMSLERNDTCGGEIENLPATCASSDESNCDSDDDDGSTGSNKDENIETLFLEEINKSDTNEEINNNFSETTGEDERTMIEEINVEKYSVDDQSESEVKIPYENILTDEPLDITSILENDYELNEVFKENKKNGVSNKSSTVKKLIGIFDNEDRASIRSKHSQNTNQPKNKSKKHNSLKKKSLESNLNSTVSEVKSFNAKSLEMGTKKMSKPKTVGSRKVNSHIKKDAVVKTLSCKKNEIVKYSKVFELKNKKCDKFLNYNRYKNNSIKEDLKNFQKNIPKKVVEKTGTRNSKKNCLEPKIIQENSASIIRANTSKKAQKENDLLKGNELLVKKKILSKNELFKGQINNQQDNSKIYFMNDNINQVSLSLETDHKKESLRKVSTSPRDILSRIEEQIRSEKLKEVDVGISKSGSAEELYNSGFNRTSVIRDSIERKPIRRVPAENKKSNIINSSSIEKKFPGVTCKKKNEHFPGPLADSQDKGELQKDGVNIQRSIVKKIYSKSYIAKNEELNYKKSHLSCKGNFYNDSIPDMKNDVLTMNIDNKKPLHFPFILGKSASKSFNIQANIQQITSLVRMLPKESIQRTLTEDVELASRATSRLGDKSEFLCPACNEKNILGDGIDSHLDEDPWDNTSKTFIRCTCMSKNTISPKHVLHQLLMQSTHGHYFPHTSETSTTIYEENTKKKIPANESSSVNFTKRLDLAKLLHATQRFVSSL